MTNETTSIGRRIFSWGKKHPFATIAFFVLLTLGPFIDKALQIDDPLFVWTAEHILKHPGDFYGFDVNWYGWMAPMSTVDMNPPTQSYFLAAVMFVFGEREIALHAAMMLVAFGAAAGIFQLARLWCERPLLATFITLCTPVFLVSATTLMCDVPMLALWIWAVVFWERALKNGSAANYFVAVLLAGLSVLTKYSALTLLPLLLILGALRTRRAGWWLVWLAIPVVMIEAYQFGTEKLYGVGLISEATNYAARKRAVMGGGWAAKSVIVPAYLGASLLPVLFFAGALWNRRRLIVAGPLVLAAIFGGMHVTGVGSELSWFFRLQMVVMVAGGIHALLLAATELWRRRDAVSLVLAIWLGSGFVFAGILNWTVSSRSFLPLAPAAAILVVRGLTRKKAEPADERVFFRPLAFSSAVSLIVATADFSIAGSARAAARELAAQCAPLANRLWFQGHWGFQFYIQKFGAIPVDKTQTTLSPGDIMVVPANNTNIIPPGSNDAEIVAADVFKVFRWLSVNHSTLGAGFYGAGAYASRGYLPYVFGPAPEEKYYVCRVARTIRYATPGIVGTKEAKELNNLGTVLRKEGKVDDAIERYEEALKIDRNYAPAHYNLGNALLQKGQLNDAIAEYEAALKLRPDNAMVQNNVAHAIWALATSPDAAVRNGTNAVRFASAADELTGSSNPLILRVLAAAQAESGNFAAAVETGNEALTLAGEEQNGPLADALKQEIGLYQAGKPVRAEPTDMTGW